MRREELIRWIAARGCVTSAEVAEALGVGLYTARQRLQRLRRRGLLRVVWAGRTAWWCVPYAKPPVASIRVIPGSRRRVGDVLQKVKELLDAGCLTTSALMQTLKLSHTQAFYALRLLRGGEPGCGGGCRQGGAVVQRPRRGAEIRRGADCGGAASC